ncbi:MAG: ribulokinase [Christensenellaceae bacterium]|nr:ribulokinase [Christensenellaceae bacterium]
MAKYSIGIDYGTLSARALLIDIHTGEEIAVSELAYPHGVMDEKLPSGKPLGDSWALQDPADYILGLCTTVKNVLETSGIDPKDVVGIGLDFTSCTILPTLADGTPMCRVEGFEDNPHAYVKLWKHHAAQYCADILNQKAEERGEAWLSLYGGKISSEWMIPKIMQIAKEAPEVYDACDQILEAGDWVVWQMTGVQARSACNAGYKGIYHHKNGYPSADFLKELDPRMENLVEEKLSTDIHSLGTCAGYMTAKMAEMTGLYEGLPVAVGIIDAHASVPACGIDGPGKMLMIMGTSTCHMLLSEKEMGVPGTCGIVKDGIMPGSFGYEAGQSCVGDHFSWFVEYCLPESYAIEAREAGISPHQLLTQKAEVLRPGQSGLLALDWWNGVRSVLMDFDLNGLILGMTLRTKPEEIYRALIEATAYGTRQIIEAFEVAGVPVNELVAAGGIAAKNPMLMQIYADVCNREIQISASNQSGALGSAIFGIAAADPAVTGYADANQAAAALGKLQDKVYRPIPENVAVYDKLFAEYKKLHDYFGRGANPVMKTLRALSNQGE